MTEKLTSLNVKIRVPTAWAETLDAFAEALELPYGSRASAVRFCIESALPMLQAMTEAAVAAKSAPGEFQERIDKLGQLMARDVEDFRREVARLRLVEPSGFTGREIPPVEGLHDSKGDEGEVSPRPSNTGATPS